MNGLYERPYNIIPMPVIAQGLHENELGIMKNIPFSTLNNQIDSNHDYKLPPLPKKEQVDQLTHDVLEDERNFDVNPKKSRTNEEKRLKKEKRQKRY